MLLALPTIIRLVWKGLPRINTLVYYNHLSITAAKSFIALGPGASTIKLITAVIYEGWGLPTNIRLGWKSLPGTNTLAYYENP